VAGPTDFDPADYWESRLQTLDLSAVGYQGLGLPYNRWLYRVRRAVFRRATKRLGVDWRRKHVLDIGSGTGFYVAEWLRLGAVVTGTDLTRKSTDGLSAAFPEVRRFQWDASEPAPFAAESFDGVSAMDVLFHIVDDARYRMALQNVARLLKPGGYFLFSESLLHRSTVRTPTQVSRPLREVEAELEAVGLAVIMRRPMFVLMNAPIDSTNRILRGYWSGLATLLNHLPALGGVVGAALYPLESTLTVVCRESPTTEVVVCRKPTARSDPPG
jgi:SAM-dependent methyltransferase